MGKKQHSKDRMFITSTEWATEWGGAKRAQASALKRLPFHCCALTFTPFEEPVCTDEGDVFDLLHIVPYINKFGKNPVTGKPLALKDLHRLTFHKNGDGEYHCPVLNKVFTEHTHIVAVKTTGNVFCYDAVKELNVKAKNWKELLTDAPFTRKDIITLQDPHKEESRVLSEFDFVKKDVSLADLGIDASGDGAGHSLNLQAAGKAVQRALSALPSAGAEALRLGGGGGKAQREHAAALAAIAAEKKAARAEEVGREGKGGTAGAEPTSGHEGTAQASGQEGGGVGAGGASLGDARNGGSTARARNEAKPASARPPAAAAAVSPAGAMSIVDAASAAVMGRSAAAAKASSEKKTKALVAAYAAGERKVVPENAKWVQSKYTSGATTRGFTSTVYTPVTQTEYEMVQVEKKPKKKGYCRVHTSLGDLNLELRCDLVPRTCENFLTLAAQGYYDGTVFHRSARNFMIQGGDPTGTGKGGQSIWGKPFKDEFDARLVHSERGVLSMANSGPHSNGSQFFILFKSAPHLNFKHAVFGKVVGGFETLSKMEKVPTDDDDRPLENISITGVTIFVNPYLEEEEEEEKGDGAKASRKELTEEEQEEQERVGAWYSNPLQGGAPLATGSGIGKYLKRGQPSGASLIPSGQRNGRLVAAADSGGSVQETETLEPAPKILRTGLETKEYGNFGNW